VARLLTRVSSATPSRVKQRLRRTWGALLAAAVVSCHASPSNDSATPAQRPCGLTVWYHPSSDADVVAVVGSWNGWATPGTPMPAGRSDGWRVTQLDLPAGEYEYAIVDDGLTLSNPSVPTLAMRDGQEVTWVSVSDCSVPLLQVAAATGSAPAADGKGTASIDVAFLASETGQPLDPASVVATARDGSTIPASDIVASPSAGTITLRPTALAPGKHTYTLTANDTAGHVADPALATVWIEPRPFDLRDTVIYQIVVDRFRNANGFVPAPSVPSARAGGTITGVEAAIESGYFASLGVNTLWISPLYKGPPGTFPGSDGRPYSDYHGYWPAEERELEPSQTDDASLDAMISAAHARGIRVLFDVVPNHVHTDNPYWSAYKDEGWFNHTDGTCICGTATCPWTTDIIDCWFTPYLADLAWQNGAVADQLSSDVRWWLDTYDGDGIRIDAVPMMWRLATRRIVNAIRTKYDHPGHRDFLLGENFVGEGDFQLLQYELGPQGLDSEFHFPLLWALQSQVAGDAGWMSDLDAVIHDGETAWAGSGSIMSLIIGNQDVPRFASVSAGDAYGDTWTPAPQSHDPLVYAKQQMALSLVFALPGAPTIYYGDEVGLAGGGDPDSRRVMPSDAELSPLQLATRAVVQRLGMVRSCSGALRQGTYRTLHAGDEDLVFAREAPGVETVVVVATRNPASDVAVSLPGIADGDYVDLMSGRHASLRAGLTNLGLAPFSVALYVPSGSVCANLVSP
jgi:glycosidase